ncbi:anaphase promoting complex subunit cdc16 [Arthrobotrys conoides]|uniref:Anaphase promoting complex subunit cdc16 n=1 Tax=Arthrobotrys conoides TaxID=74498 RepID=A0AAN8RYC7_9PEZI
MSSTTPPAALHVLILVTSLHIPTSHPASSPSPSHRRDRHKPQSSVTLTIVSSARKRRGSGRRQPAASARKKPVSKKKTDTVADSEEIEILSDSEIESNTGKQTSKQSTTIKTPRRRRVAQATSDTREEDQPSPHGDPVKRESPVALTTPHPRYNLRGRGGPQLAPVVLKAPKPGLKKPEPEPEDEQIEDLEDERNENLEDEQIQKLEDEHIEVLQDEQNENLEEEAEEIEHLNALLTNLSESYGASFGIAVTIASESEPEFHPTEPGKGEQSTLAVEKAVMEKFLREWRQDAVNKHQYDSAIFIGDKLLALTNDPNDAFFLAQIHFSTGQYTRAQAFLDGTGLIQKSAPCKYLYALSQIKQNKYEEALQTLGDESPIISNPHNLRKRGTTRANEEKYEAAMCYLRGVIYTKQGAYDKAKEAYKTAVKIDVRCFEAFDTLMRNNLLSPEEEWEFISEIDFDSMAASVGGAQGEATTQFLKALYTTRLSKYRNSSKFDDAIALLSTQYPLADNHDIVLAKAELLYTQCRFEESLKLVKELLAKDKYNFKLYPVYIACLFEMGKKNELFLMSHDLADNHREEPVTYVAIGAYYMLIDRLAEARRFFSKASVMDPSFGPAWIGFAHTFAAEGEHDQAISAYSAAAKLFQGTHLPQMFLGMQHLQLNNITLADEYLQIAWGLCKTDPLLMNELGVVFYHNEHLHEAIKMFLNGIKLADEIGGDPKTYVQFRTNLGHAYRRLGRYGEAIEEFTHAIRIGGNEANIRCSMGLCCLMEGKTRDAIGHLHEALSLVPQDPVATELLEQALLKSADEPFEPTYYLPDGSAIIPTDKDFDKLLGEDKIQRSLPSDPGSSVQAASGRNAGTVRRGRVGGARGSRRGEPDPSVMDVSDSEF